MRQLLQSLTEQKTVTAEDVLRLRRDVFGDHVVDRDEIRALLNLAKVTSAEGGENAREWRDFLCEAVADYFVRQQEPAGYVTDEDAAFLLATFGPAAEAGDLQTDMLAYMLNETSVAPASLVEYGLAAVKSHVLRDRRVDQVELARLSAFLFAAGGDGNVAVSRAEAELLFDINDASRAGENDPDWPAFFSKVVANYLMAHIGYEPLERTEAQRLNEAMADHSVNPGRFISGVLKGGLSGFATIFRKDTTWAEKNADRARGAAIARKVTPAEAEWLAERIDHDGTFCAAEQAVITHLKSLTGQLPPRLEALAGRL